MEEAGSSKQKQLIIIMVDSYRQATSMWTADKCCWPHTLSKATWPNL
jgi:hypothetical protein